MTQPSPARIATLLPLALATACDMEFTPYEEIDRFRVLAVSADDPWLGPGQSTTLRSLLANPAGVPVRQQWSWCPFVAGSDTGYACAITRDQLQAAIDQAVGPGVVTVPPFELGEGPTATFRYDLPALFFQQACEALKRAELPDFVEVPRCDERFTIAIRVVVTPEGGAPIAAKKDLSLVYADGELNTNPRIDGLVAFDPDAPEVAIPLTASATVTLRRDVEYRLVLEIDRAEAQVYERVPLDGSPPQRVPESLVFSWFIDGGSLENRRTGFIDGEVAFDDARRNAWRTPRKVDRPDSRSTLRVVARDGRDGISWITRTVRLED
jgi:hypothetical protein